VVICCARALVGYAQAAPVIQLKSLEEAVELVKRTPNVFPNGEALIEIRKLMDVENFGDQFTPNAEIAKVKYQVKAPFTRRLP
jgi:hypothetical protein